jgi:4-hydroxy-3-polyprenylbenzoate decarboxylase
MKLILSITGASGVSLGLKFLEFLPDDIDVHLVISNSAKKTLQYENNIDYLAFIEQKANITLYEDTHIWSTIASGSSQVDAMIILPCSMNTLAKCSVGISDTLITRAFSVMLKEKKDIILAPREMPYNTIQLENMTKLSSLGVVIAPPVLGYYSQQTTLDDMEKFLIGKWFDLLKIKHNLYKRWSNDVKSDI